MSNQNGVYFPSHFADITEFALCRLIELAANYFDLNSFPEGETKTALHAQKEERVE
jgi:hypothetical protein